MFINQKYCKFVNLVDCLIPKYYLYFVLLFLFQKLNINYLVPKKF